MKSAAAVPKVREAGWRRVSRASKCAARRRFRINIGAPAPERISTRLVAEALGAKYRINPGQCAVSRTKKDKQFGMNRRAGRFETTKGGAHWRQIGVRLGFARSGIGSRNLMDENAPGARTGSAQMAARQSPAKAMVQSPLLYISAEARARSNRPMPRKPQSNPLGPRSRRGRI